LWEEGFLRDHLKSAAIDETRFRQIMGSFGVWGDIFDRPLESYSQGQRKKVDLCRSFVDPGHLLIWDEPLNYIDLMSREQIEEAVLEYEPTMLFVEHDRHFVETVATEVVELGG
jgi:lincosamide and streptogramin A transport system ATP-binding/permease protein